MVEDDLSDREQEEALRNWWRVNWRWIFSGVVLGLALLAGWQWFRGHTTHRAMQASAQFQEFQAASADADKAKEVLAQMIADHPSSPYTLQARLLQAKVHVDAAQYDEAATQLRAVIDKADDDELAQTARLRLARVLIQQGKHDDAIKLLNPDKAGAFAARVREIRGDALFAKGDNDAARAEYAAALAANADAQTDRSLLEMKLQQTGGDAAAPAPQGQP
jgi:predicted negative regulator of RcsB-dependent stress response